MNCDELLRRLADYRDGALPTALCVEIDRHLRECPSCADIDHDLRDLQRMCREAPRPCLPDEARRRIESLIRERSGRP
jgi:predicted anti-sigma-YlaC factor YlaD